MEIEDNRDDDLLVDIDQPDMSDEAPAPKKAAPPRPDDVSPDVVDSLKKQLEAIQQEKDAERQARVRAEQEARQMAQAAQGARTHAEASHYQLVQGYVHQAKGRSEQIKREIKAALDAGQYDTASELQMEAAKVAARQLQYEDALADIEARAERERSNPKREAEPRREAPSDPFEAQISGLSEPSKQWLRQHRECVTDEVKQAEVVLADKQARRAGHAPDTPGYFSFIEERLGYKAKAADPEPEGEIIKDGDDNVVVVDAPKPASRSMPAAPVSRDSTPGRPSATQVRLSRAEVEIAEHLGMSPKEYWNWKQKAEKDGRYAN